MDIEEIQRALSEGHFDLTDHALDALQDDGLYQEDIRLAAASFVILDVEDGKRGTRCLIEGRCGRETTIRLVVAWFDAELFVITAYVRRHKGKDRRG